MTFLDEQGQPRQFTWRTIQTWYYRYKNHGITAMTHHTRQDKGQVRKVTPEELLEALNAAKPHFHNQRTNKRTLYRFCIEKGLLHPDRIAQTTFYRFLRKYDLLAPNDDHNKKRLAFSMKYANQLWQADTMFGPYLDTGLPAGRKQTKLIAFIDDASRVLCHGEFFFEENVDTLVQALRQEKGTAYFILPLSLVEKGDNKVRCPLFLEPGLGRRRFLTIWGIIVSRRTSLRIARMFHQKWEP